MDVWSSCRLAEYMVAYANVYGVRYSLSHPQLLPEVVLPLTFIQNTYRAIVRFSHVMQLPLSSLLLLISSAMLDMVDNMDVLWHE